jgi:hypothetical protein
MFLSISAHHVVRAIEAVAWQLLQHLEQLSGRFEVMGG